MSVSIGEVEIRSHMNGFDHRGQAFARTEHEQPARREARNLALDALAIILAGGRGSRLAELTDWRAKPAVPFGGKFRIIDFTLSNCVNSGVRRIGICTQYKAQSLIRHVQRGWSFLDGRFGEFVELLPAQQRITADWYRGTADAVYQNLTFCGALSRNMCWCWRAITSQDGYSKMLFYHVAQSADVTVACIEVPLEECQAFGVMSVSEDLRVTASLRLAAALRCREARPGARQHGHLRV